MKFDENELKEELDKLKQAGWLEDFDINNIKDIEFTSPNENDVFNAFKIGENNNIIQPNDVRILIIGQDPYPDKDDKRVKYGTRAHGLAFSFANSNGEIEPEPADDSLLNIFKAIKHYNKYETKSIDKWNTNLKTWASNNQILLLNAALTYKQEENHFSAWESFVTQIISNLIKYKLNNKSKLAIFLWGTLAQSKFLKALNVCEIIEKNNNIPKELENIIDKRYRKNIKLKTCNNLIHGEINISNIKIFLTSHPSDLGVKDGFYYEAPEHFKACDEFLGEDIWKNFPENNQ